MKINQGFSIKSLWITASLVVALGIYGCASKVPEGEGGVTAGSGTEGGRTPTFTQGPGGPAPAPNTIGSLTRPSNCETNPQLKSNPLCQIVLTGFTGELTTPNNPVKVQGYLKNNYQLDGKLQSTTWYASKTSSQPVVVTSYTYKTDGAIESIDTTVDTNVNGDMDQKIFLTNSYQNGKPTITEVTLTVLPANNVIGKNTTAYSYTALPNPLPPGIPADAVTLEAKYTTEMNYNLHPTTPAAMSVELNFLNSDNLPLESRIIRQETLFQGAPATVYKFESVESFQYLDKKLKGSVKSLYDCTKSSSSICHTNAYLDVNSSLTPYVKFDTDLDYDPKGRVSHAETVVQGDINPAGPNAGNLNQMDPYKWQCNLDYDPSNQEVVAKFPDIFKLIGLSETDKIKSFDCDDYGKNLSGGHFDFNEWSYLWQATGQAEPQ